MQTNPRLQPWEWARAVAAYVDDKHARCVRQCASVEHLRAAVAYEADRSHGTRTERVARINQRLKQLK